MRYLEYVTGPVEALDRRLHGTWRAVVHILFGSTVLALLTFLCVQLRLNLATALCLDLTLIVLLSLWGSFVASGVVSLIAVGCLNYYFVPPFYTFRVDDPFDAIALVLFLTTSAVITALVRARIRTDQLLFEANIRAEGALRQAQANLAHANRVMLVGEMTASIAHEINQPLTGVVTNAGACLRYLDAQPNLEEARQCLGLVVGNGKRAAEVIRRVRALVKKVPPRRDRLDINEAIREVIALAQNQMQSSSVNLRTSLSNGLPLVPGDRIQLQQVILNLIVNAIEAMTEEDDRPRDLAMSSGRGESNEVFVEVRDSGPGVDPANFDRLFTSFFTTKSEGMGMGLSISRSIIEAHGGRLWATPNEPHGVVFRFTLPTEADNATLVRTFPVLG
jgi:signal transduction histidine kinase